MSDGGGRRALVEDKPPLLRTLITVLITVGVVAALIGGVVAVSKAAQDTRTAVNRLDVGDDPQLAIRSTDADVRIVDGESSDVVIEAKVTSGLLDTEYELRRRGDEIEVVGSCQRWLAPGCGVEVTVAVPPRLPVLVATDSADVTVEGMKGHVVTIATGSGDIRGERLEVQELSARTRTGDVEALFVAQPFALKARTRTGDVAARIPDGEITYGVSVKSGSGDVRSSLTSESDARGIVQVVTDTGDVRLSR